MEGSLANDDSLASDSLAESRFRALELLQYPGTPRPVHNLEDLDEDTARQWVEKVARF